MQIKVKQHYTWQRYLRRWGASKQIFRLSKKHGDIKKCGISRIAFDENFYETEHLNEDDATAAASMCRELSKGLPEKYSRWNSHIAETVTVAATIGQHLSTAKGFGNVDDIGTSTIQALNQLDSAIKRTEKAGSPCDSLKDLRRKLGHNLFAIADGKHNDIQEVLEKYQQSHEQALAAIYNLGESFESAYEDAELKAGYLDNLAKGDPSFLKEPDEFESFIYFMITQMVRTKRAKRIFQETEGMKTIETEAPKFNVKRMWSIVRHCYVPRFVISISERRVNSRITLLESDSAEFITGDQPVINLLEEQNRERNDGRVSLYYPISPSRAFLLEDEGGTGEPHVRKVNVEKISKLNKAIVKTAYEQVFSQRKATLEQFLVEGTRLV